MWSTNLAVVFGLVAIAAFANGQQAASYNYEPPQGRDSNGYLPPDKLSDPSLEASPNQGASNQYLPPEEDRRPDANEGSQQVIGLQQPVEAAANDDHHHDHHGDHDHDHHLHWDLRESIPGEPGEDYPLHHSPPDTGFSCAGRIVGYYADVQAGCQAFHVCNGDDSPPQSFLCPNGTIFNQEVFACEWWNNVDCSTSESYYAKNSEIGVVIPYKGERTSLLKVQSNAANGDNDINFQPASSNEDENRLYLPPADTPPPTSTRRTTTARPTTPPSTYLPPQTQRATSRPQTQRTTSRPQPPPTISARPTFRPIVVAEFPTNDLQTPQQSDFNNNFQGYDYPKPTSTQRPILPGSSNNFQSFSETDGYDYPKPEAPFSRPETTRRPITTQRPVTTRRPVITTTTRRPVIVSTTTTRRPFNTGQSNNVPSFSEIDGYDYPKPSAGLPLPTTTRLPVTITTRRPVPTITTTRRPVTFATTRRPFVQSTQQPIAPGPSNPLPSFSETDGYSYPKPSVGLPLPTTTRLPVTITTRRPVPTFTTTRRPFIQSTERPLAPGPSNPLPSFSETDGYNYPKPSSGLPFPTTRQPAPTTTTRRPITTTQRPFNAGASNELASFSQTDGYNYPKPSVAFPAPTTTTRRPVTTTQRPIAAGPSNPLPSFSETDGYDYPKPSVGLPAPSTSRRPVTITQRPITAVPSNELPSFSENDGYSYPKPSVGFPSPTPSRQPQTSRPLPSTTRQPQTTRQPYVQPTTQRPIVPGSSELSQNVEGYNYPSPSVSFPTPTRQPVTTTTRRPVSIKQRPVTTTFRPITTQRPSSTNFFEETSGYNYPKPVSSFPFQSTVSEIQTTAVNQQFGAGDNQYSFASSSTARPIAPTDAAPEVTIGYNYPQPSAQFELPLNPEPQPSFTAAEGYNSPKPGSPFSVFQRNPQTSDTSANLINQAYQSAPPCIHNQPQNVPAPAPLEPLPNTVLAQEYLPPVSDNEEISHSVSASPSFNLNFNGYQYPKPDTGFVTGKKKPLKNEVLAPFNPAEVLSSNHELSAAQDHVVSTQFTQPFIDGFHSAQQGSSASSSFRQQQQQQQHQSTQSFSSHSSSGFVESQRSHQVGGHSLEIIPSISYSYQVEGKEELHPSFRPAAVPETFKRSKNHAFY